MFGRAHHAQAVTEQPAKFPEGMVLERASGIDHRAYCRHADFFFAQVRNAPLRIDGAEIDTEIGAQMGEHAVAAGPRIDVFGGAQCFGLGTADHHRDRLYAQDVVGVTSGRDCATT